MDPLPLMDKDIRVNAVAPEPMWTPLFSYPADYVSRSGHDAGMKRAAHSQFVGGQVLYVNGGIVI